MDQATGASSAKLAEGKSFYNPSRPHGAFDGRAPYDTLRERLQSTIKSIPQHRQYYNQKATHRNRRNKHQMSGNNKLSQDDLKKQLIEQC